MTDVLKAGPEAMPQALRGARLHQPRQMLHGGSGDNERTRICRELSEAYTQSPEFPRVRNRNDVDFPVLWAGSASQPRPAGFNARSLWNGTAPSLKSRGYGWVVTLRICRALDHVFLPLESDCTSERESFQAYHK